jgi:DNA polymerase elongation subunit (family B)
MVKDKVGFEVIEKFLEGRDPQKYIVSIEASYHEPFVSLIINDPDRGKFIEKHSYSPFLWMKHSVSDIIYNGKRSDIKSAMTKYGVKIKALTIEDGDGNIPERFEDGYKFMANCKTSYSNLIQFFRDGGVDIFDEKYKNMFVAFAPAEQFLIQTGKRLFKGMDDYNGVHRFQFDLETMGLDGSVSPIFQIGIRDNRGFELILETKGDTEAEKRDSERENIITFFEAIERICPDIITGYNSENFDWPYLKKRCTRLGIDITRIAKTLNKKHKIRWKDSMIKLGGESEHYKQTMMWGFNVLDISHSVRRAQAINSNIKRWSLKYITEYSGVAKSNRVYVPGDMIYTIWADTRDYWFNDEDGSYGLVLGLVKEIPTVATIVSGAYIIQRYLKDDLWETEQVDSIYNQAAFLIAKLLPTSYMRSSTMGTAGQWKLIMASWSYEQGLGIPALEPKRSFTGGLSRLLEVGYARDVIKLDFAALYPKTQLTHGIFPSLDISGVMEGLLTYIVDKRDEFKFLTSEHKDKAKKLQGQLDDNIDRLSPDRIAKANKMITEAKKLTSDYDKKQLPLKILANSFFGAYGAPYIFNWGDTNCAEETTCRGRQYLRLMVKHFYEKYNFRPLVGDSVTGRSPIYIKYIDSGLVDIIPIQDAFDDNSDGERDFTKKPYLVLTKSGWTDIEYVYRHATTKPIHRVTTRDRFVECTSDHSLFSDGVEVKPCDLKRDDKLDVYDFNLPTTVDMDLDEAWLLGFFVADGSSVYGNRIQNYFSKRKNTYIKHMGKRSEWTLNNTDYIKLERAKVILDKMFNLNVPIKDYLKSSNVYKLKTHYRKVAEWFSINCYDNTRIKTIPTKILNSNLEVKKAFMDGLSTGDGWGDDLVNLKNITQKTQNVMAGVNLILKDLGIDFTLKLRKDKENIVAFNLGEKYKVNKDKSPRSTDKVWSNDIISNPDEYVYDISANGTFICGVGAIICHNTDGFNFAIPESAKDIKYTCKGNHWKTNHYTPGTELEGLEAVLAEFNEIYMIGRMGLDVDDICSSTINFARKNYANDIDGKVKLVGNSIKSKAMPVYIEEFLAKGIRFLLDGKGYEFIEWYYSYVDDIYNYRIPVAKIASKSKVKMTVNNYKNVYTKQTNKAGNLKARQAHMELIIANDLDVNLGDVIYYVNTGSAKSHSDVKAIKDEETKQVIAIQFNSKMISSEQLENNPDLTNDEYNISKYLDAFNKRIKPLLVCFDPDMRSEIIIDVFKDKKTKVLKLKERSVFTENQCIMMAGKPFEDSDQDTYDALMTMEDKEIRFWDDVDKIPNNIEQIEWNKIRADYIERMRIDRISGVAMEKTLLTNLCKRFEVSELEGIRESGKWPKEIILFSDIVKDDDGVWYFKSKKWEVKLHDAEELFKYQEEAVQRARYYNNVVEDAVENRYDMWLEYKRTLNIEQARNQKPEDLIMNLKKGDE